ncbi:MAG: PepSY-associated TM helix domain-containing protein [Aquabacterium sp.]
MHETLRKSMAWLHTWAGVIIGSVLFAIFWMGSLSTFDREFDRWMQPGTRLASSADPVLLDRIAMPLAAELAAGSTQWGVNLPGDRVDHVRLFYRDAAGNTVNRALDPRTGALIEDQGSLAGTGFFFPFHFRLHIKWLDIGYWLVGLAGMAMLTLIVSGVIVHRKIFADFFLFRPRKQLQRASLDLHNLTGVLGLPFHFLIALSGLVILIQVYFPLAHVGAFGSGTQAKSAFQAEAFGRYTRPKAHAPGQLASLDAMLAQAEHQWSGGKPFFVRVWHPGDAASYVEVRRSHANDVTMNLDQIYFDAQTGQVLRRFEASPTMGVQRFISGMHFIQFDHWGLRWLYLLAGLAGCVMIATGFVFWLESRRASHARKGLAGVRVVEALTVGSVSGIVLATAAYLVVNRLLPLGATFAGQDRAALEVWVFYLVWLGAFAHAAWRRAEPALQPARQAWREQCVAIGVLSVLAVVLNAWTTGDHLLVTLTRGDLQVAGVDLMLLLTACTAGWAAHRLGRHASQPRMTVGAGPKPIAEAAPGGHRHV